MPLKRFELKDTISPDVGVDNYKSKMGKDREVVVISFSCITEKAASGVSNFVEKSFIDVLDTEVSPNPDVTNRYIVFIELKRDNKFVNNFCELIKDIENVSDDVDWNIRVGRNKSTFKKDDKKLKYALDKLVSMYDINEFMESCVANKYEVKDNNLTLTEMRTQMSFNIVEVGDSDDIVQSYDTSSINEGFYTSYEINFLKSAFGNEYSVVESKDHFFIEHKDDILVLER